MLTKIVMNSGRTQDAPARIITVYMNHKGEVVKTNSGTRIDEAGPNALRHLQKNSYGASYAEVLDADTEQQYFSATAGLKKDKRDGKIKWTVTGSYEWNPEDTERRYGVSSLLRTKKK